MQKECVFTGTARDFLPHSLSLTRLREASAHCHGCALYCNATQTVFGEGPERPALMLVGEQPGNDEDLKGKPFVGPAGRVLDKALAEAGLKRQDIYITNAVKHFKFVYKGEQRYHQSPVMKEIEACKPWVQAEIAAVAPGVIVCLGATATRSLIDKKILLRDARGHWFDYEGHTPITATLHPSAILRAREERQEMFDSLVQDLRNAAGRNVREHAYG